MYLLVEDMSEIYARPLPRVYAIFLFAIEYSAKAQHTTTGARAPLVAPPPSLPPLPCSFCMLRYAEWPEQPEPWLTTQWQTEK